MKKINYTLNLAFIILLVFSLGWFSNNIYSYITDFNKEQPFSFSSNEIKSPGNWIKESNILLKNSEINLDIKNATWSRFTDTNSMDPVIDEKSNAIKITPKSPEKLNIGDIVSYKAESDIIVIHRIIEKGFDKKGVYFITKGDNNKIPDPQKVRFNQITGVVVGILY